MKRFAKETRVLGLLILGIGSRAQDIESANLNETAAPIDGAAAASVTVNPNCPGTRFNLEPRANAIPQNTQSVDFLLNRVSSGVDLVVGAANDQRASIGGFDAYYVHRQGSTCTADFEGTVFLAGIDPTVIADPPRDAFFFADLALSLSPLLEIARTTAANLLSPTACPSGTQLAGHNPNCWPVTGVANFSNPGITQSTLLTPYVAVDPRTSGTGASDLYVVGQFEDLNVFPTPASVQIVACTNLTLKCSSPIKASGTDTFGSYPHIQVRPDGVITISYWTYTKPIGSVVPNPYDLKFVTCTPQGAPKAPVCSTPNLVATSSLSAIFSPGDSGFSDTVFPKHANRLEPGGTFTTFLVYDRCHSIIGSTSFVSPACSKVDVVYSFSTDDGASWSTPQAVESGAGHQFFGGISTDASTGTVNIAYYSTQDDFFLQRAKLRLRQIAPGSTVLGTSSILTSHATDPDAGIQDLVEPNGRIVVSIGDRLGLAVAGTGTAGESKVYLHYTWNNVFGTYSGTAQPDQNNTLLELSY